MDELTFEHSLRARPPRDPLYQPRLSESPGVAPAQIIEASRNSRPAGRPLRAASSLLAVAAMALIGAVVLFLAVNSVPPSMPAASPSPSPSALPRPLPAAIPDDVRSGVIDTPLGSARWVHLRGNPTTLPGPLSPMPGPSGLLWFDEGGHGPVACEDSARLECIAKPELWASANAISERVQRDLPVDAAYATLTGLDGTWWLATSEPTSLWRSTDAEQWESIDLEGLVSPGPAELEWEVRLGTPATASGRTVIPVSFVAQDAGRLLGRPDLGHWAWPELRDGSHVIVEVSQQVPLDAGEVRIESTADGLRFADPAGQTLATLRGADMEFVDAWSANYAIVEHQLGVVEGAAVVPVPLPGGRLADRYGHGHPTLFGADSGFHAYHLTPDGSIRTWHSDDGLEWRELDPLGNAVGEPRDAHLSIRWDWGRTPTLVANRDGTAWESTDGETWSRVLAILGYYPWRVGDGWVSWSTDTGWFDSPDGKTWRPALELNTLMPNWTTFGAGGVGPGPVIADTLFYAINEEEGARVRDLWIVEFGRAPE